MKTRLLLAALCVAIILPGPARAQTVISNLSQSASYGTSIDAPNEKEASFRTGPDDTRITQLSLKVQQGDFGTFSGTFAVSLFLADITTNEPTAASLAMDTLAFSMVGQTSTILVFGSTDLVNLGAYTLNSNTKYSLVISNSTEANFGPLTTLNPTYFQSGGFSALGTLSSTDNGLSWASYAGSSLIYGLNVTTVVPEPSAYALLLGAVALGLAGWIRGRRRVT